MLRRRWLVTFAALLLALTLCAQAMRASDWVGAYAVIDKVVFEPNADRVERIQAWGVFAIADPKLAGRPLDLYGEGYQAPQRGYLYFTLPSAGQSPLWITFKRNLALSEWRDIHSIAGKLEVIGFGIRYSPGEYPIRIRKADEAPKDPDVYLSGAGDLPKNPDNLMALRVGLIRQDDHGADYAPIQSLLALLPK